jgi:hypothetical protein
MRALRERNYKRRDLSVRLFRIKRELTRKKVMKRRREEDGDGEIGDTFWCLYVWVWVWPTEYLDRK